MIKPGWVRQTGSNADELKGLKEKIAMLEEELTSINGKIATITKKEAKDESRRVTNPN